MKSSELDAYLLLLKVEIKVAVYTVNTAYWAFRIKTTTVHRAWGLNLIESPTSFGLDAASMCPMSSFDPLDPAPARVVPGAARLIHQLGVPPRQAQPIPVSCPWGMR